MAKAQRTQVTAPRVQAERGASVSTLPQVPARDEIAARAYEIWRESGCPEGKQEEHWYAAERELRARRTARA
jgi:hypothetical protein